MKEGGLEWYHKLDFDAAIQQIKDNEQRGKDFLLDPLRFEDLHFGDVKEKLKDEVIKKLSLESPVLPLLCIDVPKANFILRPGGRPHLIDWIIYEAVVMYVISKIHRLIPQTSYSFLRFREIFTTSKKEVNSIRDWISFEESARSLSKKYDLMLVTDITSYYENISLEVLKERLLFLNEDKDYVKAVDYLVEKMLKVWSRGSNVENFGLPQGPHASSALADIFLYPVDRQLRNNRNLAVVRYMDDIRLFAKDESQLKKGMQELVILLRQLKLNLNAKKTEIYQTPDKERLKKVFDENKEKMDSIDRGIKSKDGDQINLIKHLLFELFDLSLDKNDFFEERHLKFCLARFIDLMRYDAMTKKSVKSILTKLLKKLSSKPHLTPNILWFVISACHFDSSNKLYVKTYLFEFLKSKDLNIYTWQEMWILDTLRQLKDFKRGEIGYLRRKIGVHVCCFAQIALISSMHGNVDDRETFYEMVKKLDKQNDKLRYVIFAMQNSYKNGMFKKHDHKIPEYLKVYLGELKVEKFGFFSYLGRKDLKKGKIDFELDPFDY